jgi:hypothetical protein
MPRDGASLERVSAARSYSSRAAISLLADCAKLALPQDRFLRKPFKMDVLLLEVAAEGGWPKDAYLTETQVRVPNSRRRGSLKKLAAA